MWPERATRVGRRRAVMVAAGALLAGMSVHAAFPDAHNAPPAGWTGPVFKLSQTYPATQPAAEPLSQRPWRQHDFKNPAQAPLYLKAVLDYCLAGNRERNFDDIGNNPVRPWFHAPWLHAGSSGREFVHGLTKERSSRPGELGPGQTRRRDNWAVGFYNAPGGFTIGQVWKDPARPDPSKAVFPEDTVTCKLLFTTATVAEVPFLAGTLEWQADINRATSNRPRPTVRLLQLDVAVKDPRANSTTGWVFGTFQYEHAASTSPNWWEHMVPVGLMWGSDVTRLKQNQQTQEEWINTARGQQLHLGRKNLVLNGPIDSPLGSCSACHGFAQVATVASPAIRLPTGPPPENTTAARLDAYFTNIRAATPLSPDYASLDYSLQLQLGISRAMAAGEATLASAVPPGGPGSSAVRAPAAKPKIQPITRR